MRSIMEEKDNNSGTGPAHMPGTRKGEEMAAGKGKEPGRHDLGETGADRPAGGSTPRDSTGINPDDETSVTETPAMPPA